MKNRKLAFIVVIMMVCSFILAGFSYAAELPKVRWTMQTTWERAC